MMQITIDDLLDDQTEKKLICCSLTKNYHWLRISMGHTPTKFKKKVDFSLGSYEYLYVGTAEKDEILSTFNGIVEFVPFE